MTDIIGQKQLLAKLSTTIHGKKGFPHFSILVGARGAGKKFISQWIAKKMSIQITPIGCKVDELREMIKNSYTTTTPIIYLISNADKMSESARATILKIAEEPPQSVYIIMTLESENNTLPTILSRATVFYMDKYKPSEIREYFCRKYESTHSDTEEQSVIDVCETPGEVDILVKSGVINFCTYVDIVFKNIAKVSGANCFKISENLNVKDTGKYDLKLFLKAFSNKCIKYIWENIPNGDINKEIDIYRKYFSGVTICQKYINELQITSINKAALLDMWILSIRASWIED